MKYLCLFFLLLFFSCSMEYYPMPNYNISIPELEKELSKISEREWTEEEKIIFKLVKIREWIWGKNDKNIKHVLDIELYGVIEYFATPEETKRYMAGDCEDTAILFGWLCYQYLGIKPIFCWVVSKENYGWHILAYIKKYKFYGGGDDAKLYFTNGKLNIVQAWSFEEFIKMAEYFK